MNLMSSQIIEASSCSRVLDMWHTAERWKHREQRIERNVCVFNWNVMMHMLFPILQA